MSELATSTRQPGHESVRQRRRPRTRHLRYRRPANAPLSTATVFRSIRAIPTWATSCTPRSAEVIKTPSRRFRGDRSQGSRRRSRAGEYEHGAFRIFSRPQASRRTYEAVIRVKQSKWQGRRGLRDEDRTRFRPSPTAPDRVLEEHPTHHRRSRHRDQPLTMWSLQVRVLPDRTRFVLESHEMRSQSSNGGRTSITAQLVVDGRHVTISGDGTARSMHRHRHAYRSGRLARRGRLQRTRDR